MPMMLLDDGGGAMSAAGLKDLHERKVRAMLRRPAFARAQGRARAELEAERTACVVDLGGGHTVPVDLPADEGGTGSGPHPGQLTLAGLAAGAAIGYRLWAARLAVPIAGVTVELDCDYDLRGQMGPVHAERPGNLCDLPTLICCRQQQG